MVFHGEQRPSSLTCAAKISTCPRAGVSQVTFGPWKPWRKSLPVCDNESKEWRARPGQNLWFSLLKLLSFLLRRKAAKFFKAPCRFLQKYGEHLENSGSVQVCSPAGCVQLSCGGAECLGCSFVPLFSQATEFLGVWGTAGTAWQSSPCLPGRVEPTEVFRTNWFPDFRHNNLRGPWW